MIYQIKHWLERIEHRKCDLHAEIEKFDKKQREARHDIRNLQSRADHLRELITRMRADQWVDE